VAGGFLNPEEIAQLRKETVGYGILKGVPILQAVLDQHPCKEGLAELVLGGQPGDHGRGKNRLVLSAPNAGVALAERKEEGLGGAEGQGAGAARNSSPRLPSA